MSACCAAVAGGDCHCAGCHQTFKGLTLFDAHQDVDYARTPAVLCRAPVKLGAVQDDRGTWCTPEGLKARERQRGRLAEARARRTGKGDAAQGGSEAPGDVEADATTMAADAEPAGGSVSPTPDPA